jgi:hypothetical protein
MQVVVVYGTIMVYGTIIGINLMVPTLKFYGANIVVLRVVWSQHCNFMSQHCSFMEPMKEWPHPGGDSGACDRVISR